MRDDLIIADVVIKDISKVENILSDTLIDKIKNGKANAIVAIKDSEVEGIISFSVDYESSVLEILDIYTLPEKRRKHVALTLLISTIESVNEHMDYSLNGVVTSFADDNEEATKFFEDMGFEIGKDEAYSKITYKLGELKDCKLMETRYSLSEQYEVRRYKELDNVTRRQIIKEVTDKGGVYAASFSNDLDEEFSVALWKDNSLVGCIEIIIEDDGSLCLGQFFSVKVDTTILAMLQKVLDELIDRFDSDTDLTVYISSESSKRLLTHLLGDKYKTNYLSTAQLVLVENLEEIE